MKHRSVVASMLLRPCCTIHCNCTIYAAFKRIAHELGGRLHVLQAHDGAASFPTRGHVVVPESIQLFKDYGNSVFKYYGNHCKR
jgi:hypothetical protein